MTTSALRGLAQHAWMWLAMLGAVACTERVPTTPTNESPSPGCTYQLATTARSQTSASEPGYVFVTTAAGCQWTARSNASWIAVVVGNSGTGSGSVTWMVESNSGPARTGTLTVAGQTVTVNQGAPSPSPYDGRWLGGGTGTSSASTAAIVEFNFQVTDGVVGSSTVNWRIDALPGSPQAFCNATTLPGFMRIVLGAFSTSFRSAGTPYSYAISGTFASTSSASGTIQITPEGASPWCLSATVNWSATKQ